MHTWHWQIQDDRPYLTCSLLNAWPHGFFSQAWHPALPEEIVQNLQPSAEAFRVKQVHGNVVLTPTEIRSWRTTPQTPESASITTLPDADGVVTEQADQAAWVATADCVPALVADARTGQVAAVHAGWRGTAAQILSKAIRRLQDQGSHLSDLRVALGPAIAGEVYQVSTTVAAEVGKTVVPGRSSREQSASTSVAPSDILEQLAQISPSPLMPDPRPDRARIDIRQINGLQLQQLGLVPSQIAIAPYCTYQDADRFFSYRRNSQKKVQWSGIVSIHSK
jgi:YfiH family protein